AARDKVCGRLFFLICNKPGRRLHAPTLLAYCIPTMSSRDRSSRRVRMSDNGGTARSRLAPHPTLGPSHITPSFKQKAYTALKNAIVAMDIYRNRDEIRLDERK